MDRDKFSRAFFLILLTVITVLFVYMIRHFFIVILMAAVISGLSSPLFNRLVRLFRGRKAPASAATVLVIVALVVVPLIFLFGVIAGQALSITERATPWISTQMEQPDLLLEKIPGIERLAPYKEQILSKGAEVVGSVGTFLVSSLSATTKGTVSFLFSFFLFLYTMFFFLMDGDAILRRILHLMPLDDKDEDRLVGRFVSVTRATIKGTLVIGVIQGGLAGVALAITGVHAAVFWATLMAILSIIPGVGTALVWLPAAIIFLAKGSIWQGVFLILFCGLVVGSVDNVLRPRLVGRDTQMHDLLILFSTLGGLFLFGLLGFIIGPILAALFVTTWDIYGHIFRDFLPGDRGEADA